MLSEDYKNRMMKAKVLLEGVLCDPEGYVSIQGSDADKECIQKALALLGVSGAKSCKWNIKAD